MNLYRTQDLIELSGATHRELQWWNEHGLICSSLDKFRDRQYRLEDIHTAALIKELRAKGLSLQKTRRVLEVWSPSRDGIDHPYRFLLTDGDTTTLYESEAEVIAYLNTAPGPMALVKLPILGEVNP